MASFNKVILAGNLTRDPQLSYLPSNTAVCELGMAINRKWRGQDGEMREEVCFVDIRAYGRRAETLNQYMSKGRSLLIEGHLRFDQWEGKDGGKRSKLYVVADNFTFLGDGKRSSAGPSYEGGGRAPARGSEGPQDEEMPPYDDQTAPADDRGENIPF